MNNINNKLNSNNVYTVYVVVNISVHRNCMYHGISFQKQALTNYYAIFGLVIMKDK